MKERMKMMLIWNHKTQKIIQNYQKKKNDLKINFCVYFYFINKF